VKDVCRLVLGQNLRDSLTIAEIASREAQVGQFRQ
jgi:hypothetical protein